MTATTYCNTDPKTPEPIRVMLDSIEANLRDYRTTDSNPCGGAAYYDKGEPLPWRLLYADGAESESFATASDACFAANAYADEMDAE